MPSLATRFAQFLGFASSEPKNIPSRDRSRPLQAPAEPPLQHASEAERRDSFDAGTAAERARCRVIATHPNAAGHLELVVTMIRDPDITAQMALSALGRMKPRLSLSQRMAAERYPVVMPDIELPTDLNDPRVFAAKASALAEHVRLQPVVERDGQQFATPDARIPMSSPQLVHVGAPTKL